MEGPLGTYKLDKDGRTSYYITKDGGQTWICVRKHLAYRTTNLMIDLARKAT